MRNPQSGSRSFLFPMDQHLVNQRIQSSNCNIRIPATLTASVFAGTLNAYVIPTQYSPGNRAIPVVPGAICAVIGVSFYVTRKTKTCRSPMDWDVFRALYAHSAQFYKIRALCFHFSTAHDLILCFPIKALVFHAVPLLHTLLSRLLCCHSATVLLAVLLFSVPILSLFCPCFVPVLSHTIELEPVLQPHGHKPRLPVAPVKQSRYTVTHPLTVPD